MKFTNATRWTCRVDLVFEAAPERVFPLLCPVREYDWIDGWSCRMVYSDSGVAELGAIFRTGFHDVGDETWVVSRYERGREISFVRVAANVVVVHMQILLEPQGVERTLAHVTHTFTALSDAGAREIEAKMAGEHEEETRTLEAMVNHYLRTGQKLERPAEARTLPG